jgi:hypothetical protein
MKTIGDRPDVDDIGSLICCDSLEMSRALRSLDMPEPKREETRLLQQ